MSLCGKSGAAQSPTHSKFQHLEIDISGIKSFPCGGNLDKKFRTSALLSAKE